ncbi:MAG: ABC transporter ATP-binding protein [Verrucomicrobia bacterium]|nr:ABC transporter ATP-binding protein [Cytophagales bacterium]
MSANTIIEVKNLFKSYGIQPVLKNISIEVASSQIIGYIGPNGAGKSTTIKILAGLLPDFEGEATVLGFDVRKDALEIKKRIGYVPENALLYETLTPAEYLRFIGQLHQLKESIIDKKAAELLQIFGLEGKEGHRMNTFSKGMRQKVLLISGLLHNPDIIFLDEPLSGLDANAVILVKEILAQLKTAGKTIFYSSHLMDVVEKISDRIVIINAGQIIADGTFEELKSRSDTGSLEQIFAQLTDQNQQTESQAGHFVQVLND